MNVHPQKAKNQIGLEEVSGGFWFEESRANPDSLTILPDHAKILGSSIRCRRNQKTQSIDLELFPHAVQSLIRWHMLCAAKIHVKHRLCETLNVINC